MKTLALIIITLLATSAFAHPYLDFIEQNKDYARPLDRNTLDKQIELARLRLVSDAGEELLYDLNSGTPQPIPKNISTEELKNILNIEFLLQRLPTTIQSSVIQEQQREGYSEQEVVLHDNNVGDIRLLLLLPENPAPAIIGLHGHGSTPEEFTQEFYGRALAQAGYIVAIPQFRTMGCDEEENAISIKLLENGFTLLGIHVYEVLLLERYLHQHPSVRGSLSALAHSGGSSIMHLALRLGSSVNFFVYDYTPNYLNFCGPQQIHDETIPHLKRYTQVISDVRTLPTQTYQVFYKYTTTEGKIAEQDIIAVFPQQQTLWQYWLQQIKNFLTFLF